jgi:nicotinate-nucleotide adenylyltransferase
MLSITIKDRLQIVKLATKNLKHLQTINYEIKQGGISYTVDTLEYLHRQNNTTPLVLIMGIDAFNHFDKWHEW